MAYDGRLLAGVTVLAAVVEAGTLSRAAGALGLSASGVSRAVSRLEARVGVRLLERTTRSLRLTDEGRRFFDRVSPLLAGIEDAAVEAAGSAAAVRGRLRVNVDPFFSRVVLAGEVAKFLAHYPEVCLELIMRDAPGDLVADGFDLALRFGDPPGGRFVTRKLFESRILTVASPAYVAAHGRPRHPADLTGHACIDFYEAASGRPFDWEFHRGTEVVPVKVAARLMVSDSGALLEACEAGAGVAQIFDLGTRHLIEAGRLVQLLPDWSDEVFPLYALYPARHYRPAKVAAFIDFCLAATGSRASFAGPEDND